MFLVLSPQPEVERSPKAHRLSNGSRASTSGSTAGESSSPATDIEEEEEEEEVAPTGESVQLTIPHAAAP